MGAIGRFLLAPLLWGWSFLGPLLGKLLIERVTAWIAAIRSKVEIRAKAKAEREATESAQTGKEREDAANANRRL